MEIAEISDYKDKQAAMKQASSSNKMTIALASLSQWIADKEIQCEMQCKNFLRFSFARNEKKKERKKKEARAEPADFPIGQADEGRLRQQREGSLSTAASSADAVILGCGHAAVWLFIFTTDC